MKNADMPAMPQSFSMNDEDCGTVVTHLHERDHDINIGLTKREMIAMHALSGILSADQTDLRGIDIASVRAVRAADALLEELGK